jgi:hypothetical protein
MFVRTYVRMYVCMYVCLAWLRGRVEHALIALIDDIQTCYCE